jgi:hypothetical protein
VPHYVPRLIAEIRRLRRGEVSTAKPTRESARPCGCDPGIGWTCEQHGTPAISADASPAAGTSA